MNRIFRDSLNLHDSNGNVAFPKSHSSLWAKTEVLCSHADVVLNPTGKASFAPGCPFTKSSNMVPISGVQYVMEQLFGIRDSVEIQTLYSSDGIGKLNSTNPTDTDAFAYDTPEGTKKAVIYRPGHLVQLFGIGITGTAENDITVYPVDYKETSMNISRQISSSNSDIALTLTGTMIPFRYTTEELSVVERQQYFGKKAMDDGFTAYYLKRFEAEPVIKHVWKTGYSITDDETEIPVDFVNYSNAIESFTEIVLKISTKDVKDYFTYIEQSDKTRINTIALFNGKYVYNKDTDLNGVGDYQDVRLFSKLNIPVEYLSMNKDLNIIYRVYGS